MLHLLMQSAWIGPHRLGAGPFPVAVCARGAPGGRAATGVGAMLCRRSVPGLAGGHVHMVAVPLVTWFSPWAADAPAAAVKFARSRNRRDVLPLQHVSPSRPGNDTTAMAAGLRNSAAKPR